MSRRRTAGVTLSDVARRAGVSAMTVSNVLNGAGRVSAATRARVDDAVAALNYVPNLAAARLGGARLSRVGLIYPASDTVFLNACVAAVSAEAATRGLQLLFRPVHGTSIDAARDKAREAVLAGAEGLILLPPYAEAMGEADTLQPAVPMAALATAGGLGRASTVRIDNAAAVRAVCDLLLELGHRRIAFVSGPASHSDSGARRAAFRDALTSAGIAAERALEIAGEFTFASGVHAAETLLDLPQPPTAIVGGNDDMAAGVVWVANQRGVAVPGQLSVTGFDDTLLATRVWPALTTVRQPIGRMAGKAIDALALAFKAGDGAPATPLDIVVEHGIVVRGSTGPAPL